uniref:Endoplasmic reticulum transmembrane protein n=1 Tax=Gopherus evgoodei TaxID=1825980 RepID=A0A8C4XWQ8_9SAUR
MLLIAAKAVGHLGKCFIGKDGKITYFSHTVFTKQFLFLFSDAIREMKKYSTAHGTEKAANINPHMGIPVENEKLQQCENEQALEEDNQKLRKETEKLKAELKKISNALSKATNEVTAVKKQSEGLKREYDRLMKEHEWLQVGGCGSLHEQNVLKLC